MDYLEYNRQGAGIRFHSSHVVAPSAEEMIAFDRPVDGMELQALSDRYDRLHGERHASAV